MKTETILPEIRVRYVGCDELDADDYLMIHCEVVHGGEVTTYEYPYEMFCRVFNPDPNNLNPDDFYEKFVARDFPITGNGSSEFRAAALDSAIAENIALFVEELMNDPGTLRELADSELWLVIEKEDYTSVPY